MSRSSRFGAGLAAVTAVALGVAGMGGMAGATSAGPGLEGLSAVSCPSTTFCVAGGLLPGAHGSALVTSGDGGRTWHTSFTDAHLTGIAAVDCTSTQHCVAEATGPDYRGTVFVETGDGGGTWTTAAAPGGLRYGEALACAGDDCLAVGLAPDAIDAAVARSADGGRAWTAVRIPKLETAMSSDFGLACTSAEDCVATGDGDIVTTDGGSHWTRHATPHQAALGPIGCATATRCYGIFDVTSAIPANEAASIYRSGDGGAAWAQVLDQPYHVAALSAVSCPSATSCVVGGSAYRVLGHGRYQSLGIAEVTRDSGSRWTRSAVPGVGIVTGVSCVGGTGDCVAVGLRGPNGDPEAARSTDGGTTWTSEGWRS